MDDEKVWSSPNRKPRANSEKPSLIILHATAGKSDIGDLSWCCDPVSKVSYHTIVTRDGGVHNIVPYAMQAWHAGDSEWKGRKWCNQFSIGLAWSNRHDQTELITSAQIREMRSLIQTLRERYPITAVVTHADIAPGRKKDPLLCLNFHAPDWLSPWPR